jgi:hypothetical protein
LFTMDEDLKRKLVESIRKAQDPAELKDSLLALLGVAVVRDDALVENDVTMAKLQPNQRQAD